MSAVVRSPLPDIELPALQSFFHHQLPVNPRFPDYQVFTDGLTGRSITTRQLRQDALRLGKGLQNRFKLSGKEETVAVIYSPNRIDFAQIFYGCQSVRIITSLANASYTASELAHQLGDGSPLIAFVHPSIYDAYSGALQELQTEGTTVPTLYWAVPLDDVPDDLRRRTGHVNSYQSLMLGEEELQGFDGIAANGEDAHQTALLCYSSGTVSSFWHS